ncbi:MAG: deoxynucleoside kinase [Deltaproteobacteria bacterium]|nr:deoxynucleoside kinase [Deltaproteobacteria bacterium]
MKRYIVVAGNIGSGKTSLVEFLAKRYPIEPCFEPNDTNPYLEDFYKDMKRWAFHSQIYFLSSKFRFHKQLESRSTSVIQDRSIYEDAEIFATNLHRSRRMNRRDFETYWSLYETIRKELRPPDLIIFLRCSTRAIRQRIRSRGRAMEQEIPVGYLRRLNQLYDAWIEHYDLSPVLEIPTHKVDYVTDLLDRHDLIKKIEQYL